MTGDGGIVDQGQTAQVAPTDVELERAIASVPGVVSAGIDRSAATGQSRMRLRLAPGENEEAVAWSVAATLRERFGIALDPDAIRPRPAGSVAAEGDPVRVVQRPEDGSDGGLDGGFDGGSDDDRAPAEAEAEVDGARSDGLSVDVGAPRSRSRSTNELADTRERLRLAAAQALDGVADLDGAVDLNGVADPDDPGGAAGLNGVAELHDLDGVTDLDGVADLDDLVELLDAAGSMASDSMCADAAPSGPEVDADLWSRTVIPRAAIRDLRVHREARSVQVTVVLGHVDRAEEGRATSVPTSHGTLRAVAEATVAALRELSEGPLLVGIDRVSANPGEDSPVATVVLSLLTRRGEERLLGASIIHDSPERAVLRATLDALNRRVMPLLLDRDGER